ncbi:8658_t:CDS:2 [Dentiscutata erythropus]|uniref:8658_t:CDS:1 n=1 Tax=Dentiscutata erythropus TaxID=1348616 RepID=A0A9N9NNF3_9GLOM|nr:8658_t:CDS:2 [Dentiscutata erythropus]
MTAEVKKILTFSKDTPDDVVNKAKEKIKASGGVVTNETKLGGRMIMYTISKDTITTFSTDSEFNKHFVADEFDGVVTTQ